MTNLAIKLPIANGTDADEFRTTEVPDADWVGGLNQAAGAPIGIATDQVNPEPPVPDAASGYYQSMVIAGTPANVIIDEVDEHPTIFATAIGSVAPGGTIVFGIVNRSTKTLESGDSVWAEDTN